MDNHTTDLCRSLDSVVVPIGHPYLETYWPPNHFYCRLNVRKLSKGTVTPDVKLPYPIIPDNFKQNLAAQGQALPLQGAYFKGLNPAKIADERIGYVATFYDEIFELGNNGTVRVHSISDTNKREKHIAFAKELANKNHKVDLLPEIDKSNIQGKRLFFPELKDTNFSNPDCRVDGRLADFKIPDEAFVGNTSIRNSLKSAAKKGVDICAISLKGKQYNRQEILSTLKGIFKLQNKTSVKEVWIMMDGGDLLIIPKEFVRMKNYYKLWQAF